MLKNSNYKRSKLQETRAAHDYGGSRTPGSGSQWHSKADIKTPDYLIECKTTTHQSYSLKKNTWLAIYTQAVLENRTPLMEIDVDGTQLIVLGKEDFMELAGFV